MLLVRITLLLSISLVLATGSSHAQSVVPDIAEVEQGEATRYTSSGGLTASGEPYNPERLTVAHGHLPFGTLVEVVFRRRSIVARVNDRTTDGSLVRLSTRAADQLGLPPGGGVVEVRLDPGEVAFLRDQAERRQAAARRASATSTSTLVETAQRFTVQLGSFADDERARTEAARQRGSWVQSVSLDGQQIYRVYYGIYPTREAAGRALEALRSDGIHGFVLGLREETLPTHHTDVVIPTREATSEMATPAFSQPRAEGLASAESPGRTTVRGW